MLPQLHAAAGELGWSLREEVADDFDFLRRLYCEDRAQEFGFLPEPQQQLLLTQQFCARYASYRAVDGRWFALLIDASDHPIGHLALAFGPPALHMIDIALVASARGNGAGSGLLRGLIADAKGQGWDMELHVLIDSPAGRLYQRLGFEAVSESPPYRAMRRRHP
jgi:GNAT superfamily N-acetyltransferase